MRGRGPIGLLAGVALALAACAPPPPPPKIESPPPPPPLPAASCDVSDVSPAPEPETLARTPIALVCITGGTGGPQAARPGVLASRAGQPFDAARAAADIRQMFESGKFDDVKAQITASRDGPVLTFVVSERPAVSRVRFEGARSIPAEELHQAFRSTSLHTLDPVEIRAGAERVRLEYVDHGFLHAAATTRAIPAEEGVELVVTVEEGPSVRLSALAFAGAKVIPGDELAKIATTKVGDPYRASLFQRDLMLIEEAYYDRGMVQVRVGAPELTPSADKTTVSIVVPITEGPVYRLGSLKLAGDVGPHERAYRALFQVKAGEVFRRSKLVAGIRAIQALRKQQGKGEEVDPKTSLDPQKRKIDITLEMR